MGGGIKRGNYVLLGLWVSRKLEFPLPRLVSGLTTWARTVYLVIFDYLYKGICSVAIIGGDAIGELEKAIIC